MATSPLTMPRLRDQQDLRALCGVAGERLDLPEGVVEKDYWVTQALRALQRAYSGEFIFKGGTSLSKGFRLIERFSEDIDILVRDRDGDTKSGRYRRLKAMTETAAAAVGDPGAETERIGGDNAGLARIEQLRYGPETDGPALMLPYIRLDIGILGGIEPHGMRLISTLVGDVLARELNIDAVDYDDLAPFEVPVLHPARTLVEKLMLVHTVVVRHGDEPEQLRRYRAARHFYDIHCLLGHDETCGLLANRDTFQSVLSDAERISTQHFGGVEPRPADGFAASEAFCGPQPLHDVLNREYTDTLAGYYFGTEPHPSFGDVCERVEARRDLL
jgi:hypothetical protein